MLQTLTYIIDISYDMSHRAMLLYDILSSNWIDREDSLAYVRAIIQNMTLLLSIVSIMFKGVLAHV